TSTTWRIANGKLQRASLHGQSQERWTDVSTGAQAKLRTLAINDGSVWVGGNAGALFHSLDNGENWTQVKAGWTGDIIALRFNSLQQGLLQTSTGQTWVTNDGGATWRLQP